MRFKHEKVQRNSLENCDVFDTRISNDYITKTNNVSYQPFVFIVLEELSNVADRIMRYITAQIDAIPSTLISCPNEFNSHKDIAWIQIEADSFVSSKVFSGLKNSRSKLRKF